MANLIHLSESIPVSMADDWFDIATEEHFWMKWRFEEIKKLKKFFPPSDRPIFEVGCGNGIVMNQMEKHFKYKVDGCDLNEFALNKAKDINGKLMLYNIFDRDKAMLNKYEMLILLDVIEHIDDDVEFLRVSAEHVKSGGIVLVNVPGFMHLFSKYDDEAGHKRRYTKSSLKSVFEQAGIEPLKIKYWGPSLYPIAVLRKGYLAFKNKEIIKSGFKPPGKLTQSILGGMLNIEKNINMSFPFGTSVMAVGRKL